MRTRIKDVLWRHDLGPVLIPVTIASYGVCDKYRGMYIEYTDDVGVFLLGDAYESMRVTMTHSQIIDHFNSHNYFIRHDDALAGRTKVTNPQVGDASVVSGLNPDVTDRYYTTMPVHHGGVRIVCAVPHSVVTGFGFAAAPVTPAYGKRKEQFFSQTEWHYPAAFSYQASVPMWNTLRYYVSVPLNATRKQFMDALAANVEDYSRAEVKAKADSAAAAVLTLFGYPERPMALNVPFVQSSLTGLTGLFVEPPSVEHTTTVFWSPTLTDSNPRGLQPAGLLRVQGFAHVLPQVPSFTISGCGCLDYGAYADEVADPTLLCEAGGGPQT